MKDIELPEFDRPDDFIDLCDIVESHTKQYYSWAKRLAKVTDTVPGQVQQFLEHSIRAWTVLQQLNTSLVKYRVHVVEIGGIYMAPMEQHIFTCARAYEELFISWSEYEKNHPFE